MSNGNFRRALLDVDRELASVPFSGHRDVRSIIAARRRVPWRLPALALATALAILLFTRARDREPTAVAGFQIDASPSSWQLNDSELEVRASQLELDVPGFGHVVAARGARITQIAGGIHVVGGHVDVDVIHRPYGVAPALVQVSHGTIAVLGTRFTIEQSEHGGSVMLHEGRIRFDGDGRSVVLEAGSSLSWPLAPIASKPAVAPPVATSQEPMPDVAPAAPHKPARVTEEPASVAPEQSAAPALDVDRVIKNIANLRARRRFADAAALLEQTLTTELPAATHERLSYELGEIQTYQLANPERACSHWRSHRARFPQGRYTVEVDAAVRRLSCEETKP